jgi:hypothetical protein
MPWDFETEPEFQARLDWIDTFVREQVEPLDLTFRDPAAPYVTPGRPVGDHQGPGCCVSSRVSPHEVPRVPSAARQNLHVIESFRCGG